MLNVTFTFTYNVLVSPNKKRKKSKKQQKKDEGEEDIEKNYDQEEVVSCL